MKQDVRCKTSHFVSRDLQPIFVQALKPFVQAVFVLALFGRTQSTPGFKRCKVAKGQVTFVKAILTWMAVLKAAQFRA